MPLWSFFASFWLQCTLSTSFWRERLILTSSGGFNFLYLENGLGIFVFLKDSLVRKSRQLGLRLEWEMYFDR